jgi:hypothetical protein
MKKPPAPRRFLSSQRGTRKAGAPHKLMPRITKKEAPLAPGDPVATVFGTLPGAYATGNTIQTNANYAMGTEDQIIQVVQNGATITLPTEPLDGYVVTIVADGGAVTVLGPIYDGTQVLSQGTIGEFSYSAISGEWSCLVAGSGSSGNAPLTRFRWIDGNTTVAPASQNGSESFPYKTPTIFLATLGAPSSVDDANTMYVGDITPAASDVYGTETWIIPGSRNISLRSMRETGPDTTPQGDTFNSPTITWANTAAGANTPVGALLAFYNLNLLISTIRITDGVGSAPSTLVFAGDSGDYTGTLNVSGASNFVGLEVQGGFAVFIVTNPLSGPTFGLNVSGGGTWSSANLTCLSVTATDATVIDSGTLTTTGAQNYTNCTVQCAGITAGSGGISFKNCTFSRVTVTDATGNITFDGDSWANFIAVGGTIAASTIVVVTGGFLQGVVPGNTISNPVGAALTLSITGSGASAGYTTGGNWYVVTSLNANTTITLADNTLPGTTICITRTDASAFSLTVADAGSGNLVTIASGLGDVILRYNGTNWTLVEVTGASGQNGETTIYVSASTAISGFTNVGVNTQAGAFTITLNAGGALGSTYEIFDAGAPMNASTNPITYTPASGTASVEDYRVPGAYQAAGASGQINVNGGSIRLRFDGTNKFKAVAKV